MNNEIKVSKYYSSAKMHRSLMLMEQFYMLSQNENISEKDRLCAKKLFEHYRRLSMCILMKDMPDKFDNELVIDIEYMKNMYKKYTQ